MSGLLSKRLATEADLALLPDNGLLRPIFDGSVERWRGDLAGEFAGLWGVVVPSVMEPGLVWMAPTEVVKRHRLVFVRHAREWVWEALARYGALGGYVEAGCPDRWLEVLGFQLGKEANGLRRFDTWL